MRQKHDGQFGFRSKKTLGSWLPNLIPVGEEKKVLCATQTRQNSSKSISEEIG